MPREAAEMPRMMLPPPITMPICVPIEAASRICSAMPRNTSGWMPKPWFPASTSPESFSTMRR